MGQRVFRIHPGIGVARVGDADRSGRDFYFIGPELPGVPANYDTAADAYGAFKANGKVRPQAARFRIFEYEQEPNGSTQLVGEVALGQRGVSSIRWQVHVANRKSSFCNFEGQKGAKDVPYFASYAHDAMRNTDIKGQLRRDQLELDPRPKTIDGGANTEVELAISNPFFQRMKKIKSLGQLRSDSTGRLLFIGGHGFAEAFPDEGAKLASYANNPGWFDDVSDGPVAARLTVDGQIVDADGAWVIVGPPDFAPAMRSYRSMYDTLIDVFVRNDDAASPFAALPPEIEELRRFWKAKDMQNPVLPSFTRHIYPIISSVAGIYRLHKNGSADANFHRRLVPSSYAKLGSEAAFSLPDVARIFVRIRDPEATDLDSDLMPAALGDEPYEENNPRFLHSVSVLQYALLRAWQAGRIVKDWTGVPVPATSITPDGLDRAALENCVGGAFYPGIEASWLLSKPEVYRSPFRIAVDKIVGSIPVPDEHLPSTRMDLVLGAGSLSQQLAQPWHADFRDCKKEDNLGRVVAWWPVQRPDDVFVFGGATSRVPWDRGMAALPPDAWFRAMVTQWSTRGFVVHTQGDLFEVEGPPPTTS